jgi:hypothetical protein
MRRSLTLLVTVGVLIGLMAAPAAADKPTNFQPDPVVFYPINPCTGLVHEVTVNVDVFEHQGGHPNGGFVGRAVRTGSTSDGYVMEHGREVQMANGNVFVNPFKDFWRNDDGSKFIAQGVFIVDIKNDEVQVDRFSLRCLGAPTILPE